MGFTALTRNSTLTMKKKTATDVTLNLRPKYTLHGRPEKHIYMGVCVCVCVCIMFLYTLQITHTHTHSLSAKAAASEMRQAIHG